MKRITKQYDFDFNNLLRGRRDNALNFSDIAKYHIDKIIEISIEK